MAITIQITFTNDQVIEFPNLPCFSFIYRKKIEVYDKEDGFLSNYPIKSNEIKKIALLATPANKARILGIGEIYNFVKLLKESALGAYIEEDVQELIKKMTLSSDLSWEAMLAIFSLYRFLIESPSYVRVINKLVYDYSIPFTIAVVLCDQFSAPEFEYKQIVTQGHSSLFRSYQTKVCCSGWIDAILRLNTIKPPLNKATTISTSFYHSEYFANTTTGGSLNILFSSFLVGKSLESCIPIIREKIK